MSTDNSSEIERKTFDAMYKGRSIRVNSEIFRRFNLIMVRFGINQSKFAKRVGITPGFLSDLKNGRGGMSVETLQKICDAFQVNEEWIKFGTLPSGLKPLADAEEFTEGEAPEVQGRRKAGRATRQNEDFATVENYTDKLAGDDSLNAVVNGVAEVGFVFRPEWLEAKVPSGKPATFRVTGDAMLPIIQDGDVVLVDLGENNVTKIRDGKIYAYSECGWIKVKRLVRSGDGLRATAENKAISPDEPIIMNQFTLIGRVVWVGHDVW